MAAGVQRHTLHEGVTCVRWLTTATWPSCTFARNTLKCLQHVAPCVRIPYRTPDPCDARNGVQRSPAMLQHPPTQALSRPAHATTD